MSSFSALSSPRSAPHCRVLIADDHAVVRASVRCLLETAGNIRVVAEANDGEEALTRIEQFEPDVALVDVGMPKLNGIEVTRRAGSKGCRTRILALTAFDDGSHVREALAAGAAGFVPKSAAAVDLIAAINAVAAGGHYVHSRVVSAILGVRERNDGDATALSARETEVLKLVAQGFTNKEIAAKLSLSVKTIETYKARGMEKINAGSRVDLMRHAVARGWLDAES